MQRWAWQKWDVLVWGLGVTEALVQETKGPRAPNGRYLCRQQDTMCRVEKSKGKGRPSVTFWACSVTGPAPSVVPEIYGDLCVGCIRQKGKPDLWFLQRPGGLGRGDLLGIHAVYIICTDWETGIAPMSWKGWTLYPWGFPQNNPVSSPLPLATSLETGSCYVASKSSWLTLIPPQSLESLRLEMYTTI